MRGHNYGFMEQYEILSLNYSCYPFTSRRTDDMSNLHFLPTVWYNSCNVLLAELYWDHWEEENVSYKTKHEQKIFSLQLNITLLTRSFQIVMKDTKFMQPTFWSISVHLKHVFFLFFYLSLHVNELKNYLHRGPDKLRIFVNYELKMPEYECFSNFSCITYGCHFSTYAHGFILFCISESRSGRLDHVWW